MQTNSRLPIYEALGSTQEFIDQVETALAQPGQREKFYKAMELTDEEMAQCEALHKEQ